MAIRIFLFVVLAALAVGLAYYLQRRRPDPPTAPSYKAPVQLDRDDFDQPGVETLAVVFASELCQTCPEVWNTVRSFGNETLAVQRVTVESDPDVHTRYKIDGVPTTVVADGDGVVVQAFFGFLRDVDVAEAVRRARTTTLD